MNHKALLNSLVRTPDWAIVAASFVAFLFFALVTGYAEWRSTPPPPPSPGPASPTASAKSASSAVIVNRTGRVLTVNDRQLNPNESLRADPRSLTVKAPPCRVVSYDASGGQVWLLCDDAPKPQEATPTPPPYPTFGAPAAQATAKSYGDRQRFVIKALTDAATAQEKRKRTIREYACTLEHLESGPGGEVGPDINVKRVGYKLMLFGATDPEHCPRYVLLAVGLQPGDPHFCVQPGRPVCESEEYPSDEDVCVCK